MNANEIRQKFLDFQVKHGHKVIPPAPLVLENDPTTLFTGSGMQPLLPYLLGQPHPEGTRLCDSQPSMRLQDIEDVGDPRHTTVFEMLGNWSLGDYFKKEQIENYFEFLTQVIGLDPSRIYVTCFIGNEKYGIPKDTEAAEIWQSVFEKAGIEAQIAEIGSAKMVMSGESNPMSGSSSMMTKKTGGAAVVASKPRLLVILVAQIRKSFMTSARISKTSRNTAKLIQLVTAHVSWKSVTKFSCSTNATKMALSPSWNIRTSILVAVLSVLPRQLWIASTFSAFR